MRSVFSLFFMALLAAMAWAGPDPNICNPANYPPYTGKLPVLPPALTLRVELNVVNKKTTYDIHQFIDYPGNRYAEHTWVNGTHYYNIVKYESDELITIKWPADGDVGGAQCQISQASTSYWVKMSRVITTVNGAPHVPTPLGILRMNQSMPIKQKPSQRIQDGISVNVWEGCLYNADRSETNLVTWYFSDTEKWYYAMGNVAAPILMSVIGSTTGPNNGPLYNYHHEYNFADYRQGLLNGDVDSFKVPEGIFCLNDKTSMPLPTIPSHFSMRSEIVDKQKKYVNWIAEFYDNQLNLTRYDFQPQDPSYTYGNRRLTRVHDFNDGIAYIMDQEIGNCTILPIQKYGYDDKGVGMNVRIRTPAEFFDISNLHYEYVGQRVERGVVCDVWVTQRTDWPPPGNSYQTTWEYYFSAGVVESVGTTSLFSVPVKLHIMAANPKIDIEYNFFEFNPDRASFHDYNIGQCFNSSTRADYTMVIPGNHRFLIWSNLVIFKRLFTLSVTSVAAVSPLRVTNIQTNFNESGLVVSFSLLDKPQIQGDANNPMNQPSLDQAIANLKPSLDAKNFTILIVDPAISGGFQNLIPNSYSVTRGPHLGPGGRMKRSSRQKRDTRAKVVNIRFQNKDDTGMTSGTLAGLAVGLLMAGIVIGLLVFIVIDKMREGGSSGPTSVSNPGYEK